jgi:hypothetical protein
VRRFRFRLRKLQALRRQEADVARRALAQAVAAVSHCDQRIAVIETLSAECAPAGGRRDVEPLAAGMRRGLETARARAQQARAAAAAQLARARAAYLERRSAGLAIDKLHQARRASWAAEVAASERSELEESARLVRDAARRRAIDADLDAPEDSA